MTQTQNIQSTVSQVTIGIIGGGQLGRMMALAARAMGFKIAVLDPTPNSPCGQVADVEITASFQDLKALENLVEISDVLTFEFENVDYEGLKLVEASGKLPQGTTLLKISQNRWLEKEALLNAGVAVAPYFTVENIEELKESLKLLESPKSTLSRGLSSTLSNGDGNNSSLSKGVKGILKTAMGGYDGKGQVVIRGEGDVLAAQQLLSVPCVLEKWIPYTMELSVVVVRSTTGEVQCFPPAQNIHRNNILHQSIIPADISTAVEEKATQIALKIANHFDLIGTLAIEFFLTEDGNLLVNEIAPRPHNSGHWTMDGCTVSQFEQHIRAICGWKLIEPRILFPTVMTNILGEDLADVMQELPHKSDTKVHLYGKAEAKKGRKMGHYNSVNRQQLARNS